MILSSIFNLARRGFRAEGSPLDERYWTPGGGRVSATGVYVDPETALKVSAVFQAVRLIAETLGSLPFLMYRRMPNGGRERDPKHPLAEVLRYSPNGWMTAQEWIETMTGHAVLRGNGYSEIIPGARGFVDQLIPLNPDRVVLDKLPGNRIRYVVLEPDGRERPLAQEQVFHLRGLSGDGFMGISVLEKARESMGLSLAMESYGARFFSQNATPSGVITSKGRLSEEGARRIRQSWQQLHTGLGNAHAVAVLEEGLDWKTVGLSEKDAQFIEGRNFQVSDVARWFNIPEHMLRVSKQPTFASVEQFALEFVMYTMRPWATRWEQAVQRDLIATDADEVFAEFLLEALLRGDTAARADYYTKARQPGGWMTVNEIRQRENLNPIPGGDAIPAPANQGAAPAPGGSPRRQLPPGRDPEQEQDEEDEEATRARLAAFIDAGARNLVRKESQALRRAAVRLANDPDKWRATVLEFYEDYAAEISDRLLVDRMTAAIYAGQHQAALLADGVRVIDIWEQTAAPELAALAMGGGYGA